MADMNAQALAEACGKKMYSNDRAAQEMGIELTEISPGRAVMTMTVREDMINGHDTCHGGFIFSLADTAFAYACNSHNNNAVASSCSINYAAPAFQGEQLEATASECFNRGRTGLYDIVIRNQKNEEVAYFRGNSYRIKGQLVEENDRG